MTALSLASPVELRPQETGPVLEAGFDEGWEARWTAVKLASRVNQISAERDETGAVLVIESQGSASALWYRLEMSPEATAFVSWRWRIDSALVGNEREREKKGDDYAARFFVIFDDEPFSRDARAICYVWASGEPAGSEYRNPYFSSVATVVLESGNDRAGSWVQEERDFLRDYVAAFGERPESISAVAVMSDTDNTDSNAIVRFRDIRLWQESPQTLAGPGN
jgi:hypothetical protein